MKFADAELIGIPLTVVVGRGLADGVVEVRTRATGERIDVPADEVLARVAEIHAALLTRDPRRFTSEEA